MRGVKHFKEVEEVFERRGCELIFTDSPGASIQKADPFSKATRGVIAVFAELEADLAYERSMDVLEVREDGRLYGPRSDKPAGRPTEYGPEHKFRRRGERFEHDRKRCPVCGETDRIPHRSVSSAD
jgi:DNA invertase Pin-like site-specific DNA recombinase